MLSATPQEVDNTDSLYATIELRYLKQNEILNLNESFELLPTIPTIFNSLNVPVSETLNDIFYWMKINNATDIEEIELTSSDIHNRGVGVCIVQYKSTDVSKKLVIKPEDKSFEKAVYSKDTDSLASDFNSALDNDMLGDKQKGSPIGQLDIQTSESNGSAIEYFKHKTFATMDNDEKERINKKSVENLVAFSSILGLSDLHYENAVYSEPDYLFQLIDAEVGMRYKLDSRYPIYTARYKGGMIDTSYNTRHSIR